MTKYEAIAADLRRKIHSGEAAPGVQLPAEPELARTYGVSRPVIRQALSVLDAAGLIDRRQGRGTWVRRPPVRRTYGPERFQRDKDRVRLPARARDRADAAAAGHPAGVRYRTVPADPTLAASFGIAEATPLLERVRPAADTPVPPGTPPVAEISCSYLPLALAAANPDLLDPRHEPWPGGTQHQLHTIGVEVDHVDEHVVARPPSPPETAALGLAPGVAVLAVRRVMTDTDGRVVEVADLVLPGDRAQWVGHVPLRRWAPAGLPAAPVETQAPVDAHSRQPAAPASPPADVHRAPAAAMPSRTSAQQPA